MARRGLNEMLAEANAVIETVSVADAFDVADDDDVVFVDVRETAERQAGGGIPGSVHAPRSLRRRKIRASKLISDGLWVDWRQWAV